MADPVHLLAELQSTVLALSERVRQLEARVRELEAGAAPAPAPPTAKSAAPKNPAAKPEAEATPLEAHREQERARILAALEKHNWNRVKVAEVLRMPRRTLYRRLQEYGLQ